MTTFYPEMSESRSRPRNWLYIAEALQLEGITSSEIKKWFVDFPEGKNKIQGMCQRYKIEYCLSNDEKKKRGLNFGAGVKNLSTEDEAALLATVQAEYFDREKELSNKNLIEIIQNHVNSVVNHPMQNYHWSENWCGRFLRRHRVEFRKRFGSPSLHRNLSWELVLSEYGKQRIAGLGLKFDGSTPPSPVNWLQCQKMLEKEKMKKISAVVNSSQIRMERHAAREQQLLQTCDPFLAQNYAVDTKVKTLAVKRKASAVSLNVVHNKESEIFELSFPRIYVSSAIPYTTILEEEGPMTALFQVVSLELSNGSDSCSSKIG